ncbi:MAG TPA: 3D domain-containing protein [Actinospica sp.]|nr:3D domain-containing protein [Actinospica sp.]
MHRFSKRARLWLVATAAAAASCGLLFGPLATADAAPAGQSAAAALPACPFWAAGITPPARSVTPWVPPLQTAGAVDFATRAAAPTLSGSLVNGSVTITVSPVPNAVAYRVWRDGVAVGYISYWGQTGPLTVTDTSPCQGAYYDVVALYDTSNSDASMGQLSQPYWLGSNGAIAPGAGDVPVGTQISMMVTSYNDVGSTASGYNSQLGVCATDPRVIPWGTYFSVPGYGTCYAADIGTWIQNDTVDVWLPGSQANNWGVQDRTVTVIADPYGGGSGGSTGSPTASASASASASATATGTATASSSPTATASGSASATATGTPTSGGTCATSWNAGTSYTPGQVVSYNGDNYTATYYSTGAVPNAATSWAVWSSDGACTA